MVRSRRTIGLDLELAEELKSIARSRGMSLVGYLRRLLEEVVEIERAGYFAPDALREKRVELVLSRLGFVYVPLDLLREQSASPEDAEAYGERLGTTLRELGVSCGELVERISLSNGIGVLKEDSVILVPSSGPREVLRRFLAGLARGASLGVSTVGELVVVRIPRYGLPPGTLRAPA